MKHKQLKWMLCLVALLLGSVSFAQLRIKPGGVAGAKLWLRTDIDSLLTLSGANLTAWGDASGYKDSSTFKKNDALPSTSTYAQYTIPEDSIQNGIPYLDFRTARNINYSTQLDFNYKSMFWVGSYRLPMNGDVARSFSWLDRNENPTGSSTERSFYLNSTPNYNINGGMTIPAGPPARNAPYYRWMGSPGNYYRSVRVRSRMGMTTSHNFFYKTDDSNIYSTLNGTVIWWTKEHPVQHIWAPVDGRIILGGYVGSGGKTTITTDFRGTMSEFIGFDRELNFDEVQRVESYIAMKYGISTVGYTKTFGSNHPFQDNINVTGRDYVLSDGTIIWNGLKDRSLDSYHAYMHFLVRDDSSALYNKKSTPAQSFNQRWSNYNTSLMYLDNNVTVAVGDNVNVPGIITTDKSYVVMGGYTKYQTWQSGGTKRDSVCTGTPYTYSTLVVNGSTYQVWDRTYRVKSKGIPVISMKIVPTKEAWNTVPKTTGSKPTAPTAFGLSRSQWMEFYNTLDNPNAGILVVNADGTSRFFKGVLSSGNLRVNGIQVPEDGMLYVCFDKTDNELKINEGNQVLCKSQTGFQFSATPAGGTWSTNASNGNYVPSTTGSFTVSYTVNKMTTSVNVDVVEAATTATLASTSSSNVNNGETYTLEVIATAKAGKNPLYSFAVGSGEYTTPSTNPNFVVNGSDLPTGANTLNVKVIPQVTSGSECTPTSVAAAKVITKVDAPARMLPGGVQAPALWLRADKMEQTENILDVDSNVTGVRVLKWKDLSPNAMTVAATVNGDTIAPQLVSDWGANGTPAVVFNNKSIFKTTVNKDYKAFFIVNTFAAADTALPYNTPLSIRPITDPTTDNTRFFALHPYSFLAWNGGMSSSLQKLYVYASGWGYENTVPNKSFWVDQATAQTFLENRGTGLPMMNHFVMRDGNTKFVWGSNGAGVFEYKRSGNGAVPGNPTTAEVAYYSWNGKLAVGGAYLKAGKGKYAELFYGKIAEVVAFDRLLTPKEVNKVESYLGMRYGFSLRGYNADNAEATLSNFRDYELSDGTLVYPAASDTSLQRFYADVNFLVRDDASQLNVVVNKPISHGVQHLIPDLTGKNGTMSTFPKVTNEQQGGFIRKASNVTAVVGSDFNNPAAISVNKGYFAMGKKQFCEDIIKQTTLGGIRFDKVWDASFKMKSANISKVSLKFDPLESWGEGFGHGCGIVVVTPNSTKFFDGDIVNGSLIVSDFTPVDGGEIFVILSNNILPVDVPRAICQTQTVVLSDFGQGTFTGAGVSGNVFTAANAPLGSNNVLYSQAGLTYDMVLKVYDPALFSTSLIMDTQDVQVGQAENTFVKMEGVPPGLTFSLIEGSALPDGLQLAADGHVTGIPVAAGDFNFAIKAQAGDCVKQDNFTVNVTCPTMDITSTELTSGVFNQPYSDRIVQSISNGSTIYTLTAPAEEIPAGLSLAPNGNVTATKARAVGTFVVNASLNLGNCPVVTKPISITLVCPTIAISANALQGARVGRSFAKSLAAMNGQDPYRFDLENGTTLPEGLSMDTTGLIMGTPETSTGNQLHYFDVKVTDKNRCEARKSTFMYVEIATAAGDLKLASFNAYPNPVLDGKLKVQLVNDQANAVQLQLVDIKGNVLYSTVVPVGSQLSDEIIPMAGYAPGMYFLRAICDNKTASMQVVVR